MIKVHIVNRKENIPLVEVLYPNFGSTERPNVFGERLFDTIREPVVEIVSDPGSADYLLIPHHYNAVRNDQEYIRSFTDVSREFKKSIIIFFVGDSAEKVAVPNSIIFRHSQYRSAQSANEIIMPGYSADLAKGNPAYRAKGLLPVVGFCGWADLGSLRQIVSYIISNIFTPNMVHRKGLYFRREAVSILAKQKGIETNFVIRSSYAGNQKTISIDPALARREYIEVMNDCDFALAPKGDGNFSVRFYEALSLGRIPLLIDTDCPLPLEEMIDYSKFILKVDYRNMKSVGKIVRSFYENLSPEEYIEMQKSARGAFADYLNLCSFFKRSFTTEYLKKACIGHLFS